MKKILLVFIWALLISPLSIFATDYNISSVDEFNNLNLSAGDNVIWQNGTYSSDERIQFLGTGTANNPITFRAETPGGVVFTGGLQMDIAGSYLIVDGFYWNGGFGASNFIQFRNGTTYAQNCTIRNCAINGLQAEPGDAAEALAEGSIIKHRWIVLYGNYNSVLNCTFMNKNTAGALVLAEYEYNASPEGGSTNTRCTEVGHTISNNYFYNYEKQDASLSNAGDSETIRIGTSEYQNVNSQALVSGNYFVQADGENEIITNKSMNNTYLNNTFRRCRGSLVMRHGSDATVTNNYFLGENVEGTGGIRIADSNHQITNNYIQDCISSVEQIPWNNGLTFVGGNTNSVQECSSTSVSNAYQDVENINFSNNTFINTHSPFYFNATRDGADNVFGDVSNNLIYFESNNDNTTDVINGSYTEVGSQLTFSGNVYNGATSLGGTVTGFTEESITVTKNGEIFIHNQTGKGASISDGPITDSMVGNGIGACFLGASGSSQTDCNGTTTPIAGFLTVSSLNEFSANEGSQIITISSNIDWTVSEDTTWISVNKTSGSGNDSISVTATENTSTSSRTATIAIIGSEISRSITVSQTAEDEIVIVTPPDGPCVEGTNLSLNATIANFSAEENSINTVLNILNENNDTRWSAETFPQHAVIDLGAVQSIDQISLSPYLERDYQFIIEGSSTSASSNFSTLVDASNNTISASLITKSFDKTSVRYVKLTITGAATYDGVWSSINYLTVNCAGNNDDGGIDPVIPITLDPNLAPSKNFDLSKWNLGVPLDRGDGISTTITVEDLNNDYELKDVDDRDYFYTAADGGMVFRNYPKDAYRTSERTKYSRTELRELLTGDDEGTKDPDNNWYFSSSDDIPSEAGGIDGVLTATLAVNRVTTDGDSNHKGRVVIGQIHASSNEPNRLYYHKLPEHNKGAIYVAHEDFGGSQTYYNIIGNYIEHETSSDNLNDDIKEPTDGIELNEQFSYKIEVIGNDQWVTISRAGKADVVQYIDMSDSEYENDWMYFKAGVYSQNNSTDLDDDYDQATFYALSQTHDGDDITLSNAENILNSLNNSVIVYPNPFIDTINIDFLEKTIIPVAKVRVIDALGRDILNVNRRPEEESIELHANFFSTGFYFVQLLDGNDKVIATKKVIKK